jgi:linoleoyl-CoA desaturase
LPVFIFHIAFVKILLGYLLMQFISGVILTVVFQLAHTVEGTTHPLPNENYTIENNWAIHQMNTTVNFSRHNKLISWYVGGLNFQVEHHLFPNICHVHYPEISEIVKSTAEEFGIPYLENDTFMTALNSHIKAVIQFGKMPNINEAIV